MNYEEVDYLVAFEKYAQMLSQNFNVNIFLDGQKAETHQDHSIHLPNIKNISKDEVDMLYGILLHEICHVLYSNFNEEYYKKIKSEKHFTLWNFIEDARVENKIINKFSGANDILEDLYLVYIPKMNAKHQDNIDPWFAFGAYIHDYFLKTKNPIKTTEQYNENIQKEIKNKFQEIKPIIDNTRLLTFNDAFVLANKIYKYFFKDKEEINPIKNAINSIEKCQEDLKKVYDSFKENKILKDLKDRKKDLDKKKKEMDKIFEKSNEQEMLDRVIDQIYNINSVKRYRDIKSKYDIIKNEQNISKQDLIKKKKEFNDLIKKLDQPSEKKEIDEKERTKIVHKKPE